MIDYKPTQTTTNRTSRMLVVCLLLAVLGAIGGYQWRMTASLKNPLPSPEPRSEQLGHDLSLEQTPDRKQPELGQPTNTPLIEYPEALGAPDTSVADELQLEDRAMPRIDIPRNDPASMLSTADGIVPDGTTVFDHDLPGIDKLDPALLAALRQAAMDAADAGISLYVTSGWRSPTYQNQLFLEAVATYGSEEQAAQWVATAATSPHVSGVAVDIGGYDAMVWLAEHGSAYGLCQIYGNEAWHYELRPDAVDYGCPPMYPDPTYDPRMQQ